MLNTASLAAVNSARFSQHFVKPRYDSYCFSNIPATIQLLLTGGGTGQSSLPLTVFDNLPTHYDKVVFFFIDGFGWRFYTPFAEQHEFLKAILARGVVSKLTAQFPSTTAAHVTCMHTGLEVGQAGVYEWNYYEPLVDAIISPLLFAYAGDARDSLQQASFPPEAFFPRQTFYNTLAAQGVVSHVFQHQAYTLSTYSKVVFRGANVHPYASFQEALVYLTELLKQEQSGPSYYFVYFDRIDLVCHRYGPAARQFVNEVETCLTLLYQLFYKEVLDKAGKTLCLLSADHGHVEVEPQTTFYLDKQVPTFKSYLKTNQKGQLLVPAGSARDMFLHVKEDRLDEAVGDLQQQLQGRAEVYRMDELLAQHFFGQHEPSPVFLARVGNVVILPYKNETVWWYEDGKFAMNFHGHHGGLTPQEMEIPLLLFPL